ncbi:hypothetical protein F52700_8006 [Fusarium sp. NRRL 52700]|nr:hypothetical protein F52700_8006 [Fusarium sp. NRRL 52700]
MSEDSKIPIIKLQGSVSDTCFNPGLLSYWKLLLNRRLAWIRHHHDHPSIIPELDTSRLIVGVDGLPTCHYPPPEPDNFQPIHCPSIDTNTLEMRLLFQPANRAWAREHVAPRHLIERVTSILQNKSVATHVAWFHVFDSLYEMGLNETIKTLHLMEQIVLARQMYTRDIDQLKYFAENPHTITQRSDSLCIHTMCRLIGIDFTGNFDWLYGDLKHLKLECRAGWIRDFILPAHKALAAHAPDQRAEIAAYVGGLARGLQEADRNVALYTQLDSVLLDMLDLVRSDIPPL